MVHLRGHRVTWRGAVRRASRDVRGREGGRLGLVGSRFFLVGFFVPAQRLLDLVLELLGSGGAEFN